MAGRYELIGEENQPPRYELMSETGGEPTGGGYFQRSGRKLQEAGESAWGGWEALKELAIPSVEDATGLFRNPFAQIVKRGEQMLRLAGGVFSPVQALTGVAIGAPVEEAVAGLGAGEDTAQIAGTAAEMLTPALMAKGAQMGKLALPAGRAGIWTRELLGMPPAPEPYTVPPVRPLGQPEGPIRYRYTPGTEPLKGEQAELRLPTEPAFGAGIPEPPVAPLETGAGPGRWRMPGTYRTAQEIVPPQKSWVDQALNEMMTPTPEEQLDMFSPWSQHKQKVDAFKMISGRSPNNAEMKQLKAMTKDQVEELGQRAKEIRDLKARLIEDPNATLPPTRALAYATEMVQAARSAEALGARTIARQLREDAGRLVDQEGSKWLSTGMRPGSSTLAGSVAGSAMGFEQDDEGKIWFDPGKALLGAVAGVGALNILNNPQQAGNAARGFAEWFSKKADLVGDWYQGRKIPTHVVPDLTNQVTRKIIFPHTLAENFPLFKPIHEAAQQFFEKRSTIGSIAAETLGDALQKISPKLREVLNAGTLTGKEWGTAELKKFGLGDEDVVRYFSVRKAMKYAVDELERSLVHTGVDPQAAADAIAPLRNKTGFVPIHRFGNYHVVILDGQGDVAQFFSAESQAEHNVQKTQAAKMVPPGGSMRAYKSSPPAASLLHGMDVSTLAALAKVDAEVQDMLGGAAGPLSLTKLLARAGLSAGGFPKHLLQQKGIPGFSQDMPRVLADYFRSLAQYVARREAMHKTAPLIREISEAGVNQLADYSTKYMNDVVNPTGDYGRLREGLFNYYLAGKLSSALVNLSGYLSLGYPVVGRYSNRATAQWTRGLKDAFLAENKLNPEVAQGLHLAKLEGIVGDPTTQELLGTASGRSPTLRGVSDLAGALFGRAETAIRRASYIAGHNIAREEHGLSGNAAHEFAKRIVREANLDYTKADRPELIRAGIAAPFGTFRLFQWNVLSKFKDAIKRGEYGTLARYVGTLGAIAGLVGMPGAKTVVDVARSYGYDIPTWVRSNFGRGGEVALRGPLYAAGALWGEPDKGIDLSGSAGIGDVVPSELFTNPWEGVSKLIFGVMADPVVRGIRVANLLRQGEPGRAAEAALPEALRSAVVAGRAAATGAWTTAYGEPVVQAPSSFDLAMRATGFQPTTLSRAYEREAAEKSLRVAVTGNSEPYYRAIAKGIASRDPAAVAEALAAVRRYNESADPSARIILNSDNARAAIRRHVWSLTQPERTEIKSLPKKARPRYQLIQELYK